MEQSVVIVTSKQVLEQSIALAVEKGVEAAAVNNAETTGKPWLNNKEAIEFLGLSKATVQRLRRSGQLPFSKVNGSIFYERRDIIDLLERNRRSR